MDYTTQVSFKSLTWFLYNKAINGKQWPLRLEKHIQTQADKLVVDCCIEFFFARKGHKSRPMWGHADTLLHCWLWVEKHCMNSNHSCCFVALQGSNVVEDQDLLEIGILNSAHRQRLLQAIRLLPRVSTAADQSLQQEHLSSRASYTSSSSFKLLKSIFPV